MTSARARILEFVRTAGRPVAVEDVAAAVGLGLNAVRYHLAALEGEGLVVPDIDRAGRRGRPRRVFTPGPGPAAPDELLALALLHAVRRVVCQPGACPLVAAEAESPSAPAE